MGDGALTTITRVTPDDYEDIISHLSDFWPTEWMKYEHHPMYVEKFSDTSFVAKENGGIAGYAFGFVGKGGPKEGYLHLIAVRDIYKKKGIGQKLYEAFEKAMREAGCSRIRLTIKPDNLAAMAFHTQNGFKFTTEGAKLVGGIPTIHDYAGPGAHRVVMTKVIA